MSNFSMKPTINEGNSDDSSNVSTEGWAAWNEYLHNLVGTSEVPVVGKDNSVMREKTEVGILNFIMDMGFQPQSDGEYDTKVALPNEGEEYSAEELQHMEKYPTNDYIWVNDKGVQKRKQTSPKRPEQEYAFFFDFPEIIVDWTQHPSEEMHKLGKKPLRVSYNGRFGKSDALVFNRRLPFSVDYKTKVLSPNNPISKMSDSLGVLQEYVSSKYDLGTLAGKACKWKVRSVKNTKGDKVYYNTEIRDASKIEEVSAAGVTITVEQQTPKCDVDFVGVFFDAESYDPEIIGYIKNRKELVAVVKRAVGFKPSPVNYPDFVIGKDYADSGLAKVLDSTPVQQPAPTGASSVSAKEDTPAPSTPAPSVTTSGADAFDDDIPF